MPLLPDMLKFKWHDLVKTNHVDGSTSYPLQGLSVPFACVGSGDPVRVLRLYTTNTQDIFEAFIAEAYVQLVATNPNVMLKPYALRLPTATATCC